MTAKLDIVDIAYDRFKPIFDGYDKDHSSTLERPEFQKLLADCLGVEETDISNDQLEWHFSRIDKDGDGKITFDEYISHFFGERAKDSKIKNKKEGEGEGEDELIDIQEFRKLMEDTFKPLNIPISEEMVQWNFDKIDTDKSGRISFAEYLKFVKKYNP